MDSHHNRNLERRKMKKNKQIQESTDIVIEEATVASLTLSVYETGDLSVQFNIVDPQRFHATEDSKTDLNELISQAIETSKEKFASYTIPQN